MILALLSDEHEDAECLDVLYRVHMISESEYQSQKSSRQSSRAASIHEVETEDTGSTLASVITEPESRNKISLDSQVSAGGSNFSAGQRQLIAMVFAYFDVSIWCDSYFFFATGSSIAT